MNNKYSIEQINILKKYYTKGEWDSIIPFFPNLSRVNIRAIARRYGIYQINKKKANNVDLTGKQFGKLTVLYIDTNKIKHRYWVCKCSCGNTVSVSVYSLIKGVTKSCGCLRHKPAKNTNDLTGKRFGMLVAVERITKYRNNATYYRCICDCGKNNVYVSQSNLRTGHTRSCGSHCHKRIEFKKLNYPLNDDDRTYLVYRHIAPNGKAYIGITKQNTDRRFQNGNGYKTQQLFWRAIKKYGWTSFKHEILDEHLTEKEACEKEKYYIMEIYKTFAPYGYNVSEGGNTGPKIVTPIVQYYNGEPVNFFESISVASKILKIAQQTINLHIGSKNSIKGYYFERLSSMHIYDIPSEYYSIIDESHYVIKKIIADNLKNTTIVRNLLSSKPINQYNLDGKYIRSYRSISEAKRILRGKKGDAICAAVNPNRNGETAYGYMWRYDNGDHSDIQSVKYKKKRAVLQLDVNTGEIIYEYDSMAKAARSIHAGISGIKYACENEEMFHGCLWKFKENFNTI